MGIELRIKYSQTPIYGRCRLAYLCPANRGFPRIGVISICEIKLGLLWPKLKLLGFAVILVNSIIKHSIISRSFIVNTWRFQNLCNIAFLISEKWILRRIYIFVDFWRKAVSCKSRFDCINVRDNIDSRDNFHRNLKEKPRENGESYS